MNKRLFFGSLLGLLVSLPLGIASAAGGGGGGNDPSPQRQWCRGGTVVDVHDQCGNLIYRHCLGGRDSGSVQQVGMACN